MANSYAAATFVIDTDTNVAGLTALKGSAPAVTDHLCITNGATVTAESDLDCASLNIGYGSVNGGSIGFPSHFVVEDDVVLTVAAGGKVYGRVGSEFTTNGTMKVIGAGTGAADQSVALRHADNRAVMVDGVWWEQVPSLTGKAVQCGVTSNSTTVQVASVPYTRTGLSVGMLISIIKDDGTVVASDRAIAYNWNTTTLAISGAAVTTDATCWVYRQIEADEQVYEVSGGNAVFGDGTASSQTNKGGACPADGAVMKSPGTLFRSTPEGTGLNWYGSGTYKFAGTGCFWIGTLNSVTPAPCSLSFCAFENGSGFVAFGRKHAVADSAFCLGSGCTLGGEAIVERTRHWGLGNGIVFGHYSFLDDVYTDGAGISMVGFVGVVANNVHVGRSYRALLASGAHNCIFTNCDFVPANNGACTALETINYQLGQVEFYNCRFGGNPTFFRITGTHTDDGIGGMAYKWGNTGDAGYIAFHRGEVGLPDTLPAGYTSGIGLWKQNVWVTRGPLRCPGLSAYGAATSSFSAAGRTVEQQYRVSHDYGATWTEWATVPATITDTPDVAGECIMFRARVTDAGTATAIWTNCYVAVTFDPTYVEPTPSRRYPGMHAPVIGSPIIQGGRSW